MRKGKRAAVRKIEQFDMFTTVKLAIVAAPRASKTLGVMVPRWEAWASQIIPFKPVQ